MIKIILLLITITLFHCENTDKKTNTNKCTENSGNECDAPVRTTVTANETVIQEITYRADGEICYIKNIFKEISFGAKCAEFLVRTDSTIRKVVNYSAAGIETAKSYYDATGLTECNPPTTKCVASDPD